MTKKRFSIKDPQDYTVTLHEDTWQDHILDRHPEMSRHLEDMKDTISDPDLIYRQPDLHPKSVVYMRTISQEFNTSEYVIVAATRDEEKKRGYVKTAFSSGTSEPPDAEIIWNRHEETS